MVTREKYDCNDCGTRIQKTWMKSRNVPVRIFEDCTKCKKLTTHTLINSLYGVSQPESRVTAVEYALKEGLCSIYDARPSGCREYPWYNVNGKLYYDAGCPGMKSDADERPDVSGIQPFENFFPGTSGIMMWLVNRICIRKP